MLDKKLKEEAKALFKQYSRIFQYHIELAERYVLLVYNLERIDQELKKDHNAGKKHTETLLKFLKTNVQFKTSENFLLTLKDVIRLAEACSHLHNYHIQEYANEVSKDAAYISYELEIPGFNFVNINLLNQLNMKKLGESKKENRSKHEAGSENELRRNTKNKK